MHPKSKISLQGATRQSSLFNSQFIQKVREEDRYDKILDDTFIRSSNENPYHKRVYFRTRLCEAINDAKREQFVEEKRLQANRLNKQELLQLGNQLRAAYVSKAIATQKFEHNALEEESTAQRRLQNTSLEQARWRQVEYAKMREEEQRKKKAALKEDLLQQMEQTNAKRQEEKTNLMKEKQMREDAAKKYKEDLEREAQEVVEKKMKVKADIEAFNRAQEEWKIAHCFPDEYHEKGIEYLKEQELKKIKAKKDRKDKEDMKNKITEHIGKQVHAIAEGKRKFSEVLTELLVDERKAKEEIKRRQERERQIRLRADIREDLAYYNEERYRRKQEIKKQKEEDCRVLEYNLAEFKKEKQLLQEKKRQKILEYRRALLDTLDQKKRFKTTEMKSHIVGNQEELDYARREQELVNRARVRLLKEHVPGLKEFLPPGTLRPSDLEHLSFMSK